MKNKPRLSLILIALVVGLAFGFSLSYLILPAGNAGLVRWASSGALALIGFTAAYFTCRNLIYPRLAPLSKSRIAGWVSLCLLAGFGLVIAIPWMSYPKVSELSIVATGKQNSLSAGSEVWLVSITNGLKTISPGWRDICAGGWAKNEGMLVSAQDQPSKSVCRVDRDGPVTLRFATHRWSGIVRVIYQDRQIERDLYSEKGDIADIKINVNLTPTERVVRWLVLLANGLTLSFLCLVFSVWAVTRPIQAQPIKPAKPIRVLIYALPIASAWFIYLLAYWPGFLSKDSLNQFLQIASGKFADWHPAFHTMTLWLITRLWFSPASVVIVQVLILSALLGWGFFLIEKQGTPRWATWLGVVFLAISPAFGLVMLNPWKDVAYGICVVGLVLLIFMIVTSAGESLKRPIIWISLGIVAGLVGLFRHNGWPVAVSTFLLLFIGFRRQWKPLLVAMILAAGLWIGVKGPLYTALAVNQNTESMGQNLALPATAISVLEWYGRSGIALDPVDQTLVDQIMNSSDDPDIRLSVLAQYTDEIDRTAIRVARQHPLATIKFFLERSTYIFQILQPPLTRIGYVEMAIYDNPFGLRSQSLLPIMKTWLTSLAYLTEKISLDWLFWRNAFWMYFLVFGSIVAWARTRQWQSILIITPVLVNAGSLALFSAGHITRYILPTLLVGPLLCGYFLLSPLARCQPPATAWTQTDVDQEK
jgi:hypothetical protein